MKILHKTCLWKSSIRDKTPQSKGEKRHMIQPWTLRGYTNFPKLTRFISRHTAVRRTAMSRRHLLTLETTVFTAVWVLPTTSSVVLRGITRTWAFTFPYRKKQIIGCRSDKQGGHAISPPRPTCLSGVCRVKSAPEMFSTVCCSSVDLKHVRLTATGASSTAPVEQFIEITIT